ncbi:IspD/TarI family cytidylyltransferase [Alicyclobacillus sp. ALC3]|uniref:IspD/TarI family cytidylyltransferase n=1 Tax=Alicyclobacillus sp. ALC3 TaxID=2796143 RepID=UPI002378488C|nr:IspD/TarI family cytidylyltransferase [Alicyclobacillus sp. ALC3]WDL98960.1 2-C-methyl-D-erythritol 4-phosphate cytidylyltransferase [Alicyclobacillus sp. ALC3]
MIYAVLVAAGLGSRMGFRKQYAVLAGVEVWERSARALLAGGVHRICLVIPLGDVALTTEKVDRAGLGTVCRVVAGGDTRAQSVACGVAAVEAWSASDTAGDRRVDIVAVHDAARPFVAETDVRAVLDVAIKTGAAVLGRRCIDTMKWVERDKIERTLERSALWHALTPQVFRLDWLKAGFAAWTTQAVATDDSALVEKLGYPVTMVEATAPNPKLTTPEDFQYADWLAQCKWGMK